MSETVFPAARVRELLQQARSACKPAKTEFDAGWSLSCSDPNSLLAPFSSLALQPGWRLIAYQFTAGGNGNGVVYGYPATLPVPAPAGLPTDNTHWLEPPKPRQAVAPMTVIQGDGSSLSYLQASLLAREVWEFGARWHGCSWSTHELYAGEDLDPEFTWQVARPGSFDPTVSQAEAAVSVTFYTRSDMGQCGLYRHVDRYTPAGGYRFTSQRECVAVGPPGYIF